MPHSFRGPQTEVGSLRFPFSPAVPDDSFVLGDIAGTLGKAMTDFGWLAQDAGEGGDFLTGLLSNPLILPVGLLVIFYLTFIAPERRRRAEEAKMMAALKKNDRVVTVGGIHGTVVAAAPDGDVVTLRIDESSNTRIKVNRTAIAKIVTASKDKENKTKDSEGEPQSGS